MMTKHTFAHAEQMGNLCEWALAKTIAARAFATYSLGEVRYIDLRACQAAASLNKSELRAWRT